MKAKARAVPAAAPDENPPFWKRKTLTQMSRVEWESLCDGCGKCCLHKLEDTDTGALAYTNVACRLLDLGTCRCTDYAHRHVRVPDCIRLSAGNLDELRWLPMTCAYRLVAEERELYWWHHLVSGDRNTVHQAGMSVRATAIGEDDAGALEDHVVAWEEVPAPRKLTRSKS